MSQKLLTILKSIVFVSLFFSLMACSSSHDEKVETNKQKLTIAFTSWPGFDIIYYAEAKKLFEKEGLNVVLKKYPDQASATLALQNGQVDAAMTSIWDALSMTGDNTFEIILSTNVSAGADGIVARKGIGSIEELRGKKVSAQEHSVNQLILLEALELHGMTLSDVVTVDMTNEEAISKLYHKKLDAAVLWEPLLSKTQKKLDSEILFTTKELNSLVIDLLVVNTSSLQKKQALWQKYICIWFDLMHDLQKDRSQIMEVVAQKTLNPNFAKDYAGLHPGDITLNTEMFLHNRLADAMKKIKPFIQLQEPRAQITINATLLKECLKHYKTSSPLTSSALGSPK